MCLKCAKAEHSIYYNDPDRNDKICIPEFIMGKANKRYNVNFNYVSGEATCTDRKNSCKRKFLVSFGLFDDFGDLSTEVSVIAKFLSIPV